MTAHEDDSYDGFRTFTWLADISGLEIDQLNFLLTQFATLGLAGILRKKLHPPAVSPNTRHAFGLFIGLAFGYFCFGKKAIHIVGMPTLCYFFIRILNPHILPKVVLFVALSYLSCLHLYRQIYDYNSYSLDVTGPLMVITQKVTSLAFNLHDGLTHKKDLSPLQKHQSVQKIPTALEYFSYVFHFQALMAGPVIFYRDFIDFIHGRRINDVKTQNESSNIKLNQVDDTPVPSPMITVIKKVLGSIFCALVTLYFTPMYTIHRLKDEQFVRQSSFWYTMWYLEMTTMLTRFKYYHAWIFADAICNNSGLGFNGYDENGKARWDRFSNVDAFKFETSLNLRDAISAWNKGTNRWLRALVYERTKRYRTIFTYTLSALWHGFYPGYYITFANGALFTFAARSVRRHVRPYFLSSKKLKILYDMLTLVTTRIIMSYMTFSFILLDFQSSINVYLKMKFVYHLLGVAATLFLPLLPCVPSADKTTIKHSSITDEKQMKGELKNDSYSIAKNNFAERLDGNVHKNK